jgi:hypothetical protein
VASHIVPYFMSYTGLNASLYYNFIGELGTPVNNPAFGGNNVISNNNSTVWSINAATGAVNWHYFIPIQGYRGGVTNSGNMVFATLSSGDMIMLNALTGKLVRDYYVGAPMDVTPSVGASINGTEYVILPVGTCNLEAVITCPGQTPGDILALSLQGQASATTTTVTASVSVSTTTTTVTASVSTTTTTAPGGATTGFSAATVYGLVAVAVIFIIATGYLAMTRGRKPAP